MARIESEIGIPKGGFLKWIDDRFPWTETMKSHATEYYASKNFNWWYVFGVLALLVLVMQIVTGVFLTMNYKPSAAEAFASVEYIMRDVEWGWLIRYVHHRSSLADSRSTFRDGQRACSPYMNTATSAISCKEWPST